MRGAHAKTTGGGAAAVEATASGGRLGPDGPGEPGAGALLGQGGLGRAKGLGPVVEDRFSFINF